MAEEKLDKLDQELIARLRLDGRMPYTQLAAELQGGRGHRSKAGEPPARERNSADRRDNIQRGSWDYIPKPSWESKLMATR